MATLSRLLGSQLYAVWVIAVIAAYTSRAPGDSPGGSDHALVNRVSPTFTTRYTFSASMRPSVAYKTSFAANQGFGGVMIWELGLRFQTKEANKRRTG